MAKNTWDWHSFIPSPYPSMLNSPGESLFCLKGNISQKKKNMSGNELKRKKEGSNVAKNLKKPRRPSIR